MHRSSDSIRKSLIEAKSKWMGHSTAMATQFPCCIYGGIKRKGNCIIKYSEQHTQNANMRALVKKNLQAN